MADNSKLVLPGNFEKGKKYLLDGGTLESWRQALLGDRVIPGPGITESQVPGGRIFKVAPGAADAPPTPWQITASADAARVGEEGSVVFESLSNDDLGLTITDLGDALSLSSGTNYIVLEGTVADGEVTALAVSVTDTLPDIYTVASGAQTKATRLLGIVTVAEGAATVEQITATALTLEWYFQGVGLLILRPY